mmetsp:Transcript_2790/g.8211  ORF Transcript_2790/g.8211 Transcript_2790/m.8211 type:complete len:242 (+) Transcript_2790:1093-1818(+)
MLVPGTDWPALPRPRQGPGGRQRLPQAPGGAAARLLLGGPQDQGQARAQVGDPEVRAPARARAPSARLPREHSQIRGAPVRQGAAARRGRAPQLRHLGRPAEGARAAARARQQAGRLRQRHQGGVPARDHRLLLAKLLQAAPRHARPQRHGGVGRGPRGGNDGRSGGSRAWGPGMQARGCHGPTEVRRWSRATTRCAPRARPFAVHALSSCGNATSIRRGLLAGRAAQWSGDGHGQGRRML